MASRTPSRGKSRSRQSQSNSNAMPMVLGGVGLAVVVVLLIVMNGGKGDSGAGSGAQANTTPPAAKPAPAAAPVQLANAKAGKTPGKPAPSLTSDTLQQARTLLDAAKSSCNEGVKARTAGDNSKARELQSAAKAKIDEMQRLLKPALDWQEEAQLDDWAQPAEYVTLERFYVEVAKVEKMIRMNGGT